MADGPLIDYQTPETARRSRLRTRRWIAATGSVFYGIFAAGVWALIASSPDSADRAPQLAVASLLTAAAVYCAWAVGRE